MKRITLCQRRSGPGGPGVLTPLSCQVGSMQNVKIRCEFFRTGCGGDLRGEPPVTNARTPLEPSNPPTPLRRATKCILVHQLCCTGVIGEGGNTLMGPAGQILGVQTPRRWCLWVKLLMLWMLDYHAVGGWKRAEPAPLDITKTASSRPLVGAAGRNNWFSKWVARQHVSHFSLDWRGCTGRCAGNGSNESRRDWKVLWEHNRNLHQAPSWAQLKLRWLRWHNNKNKPTAMAWPTKLHISVTYFRPMPDLHLRVSVDFYVAVADGSFPE